MLSLIGIDIIFIFVIVTATYQDSLTTFLEPFFDYASQYLHFTGKPFDFLSEFLYLSTLFLEGAAVPFL